MAKKIAIIVITVAIFTNGLILPIPVRASGMGNVLSECGADAALDFGIGQIGSFIGGLIGGGEVPVKDEKTKAEVKALNFKNCVRAGLAELKQIALETLKRRVLDAMVDQTIAWIQGDGDPQFITDFGGFLRDAGNAAVGDVVQEIGLSRLCQPFNLQLRITLAAPPSFRRQISCTLDQIVDNIENFYGNFADGGWLAFNEIYRPQNNYYGSLILALNEQTIRLADAQAAAQQEATAGQGFTNTKRCLRWSRYITTPNGFDELDSRAVNDDFNYPDPKRPPTTTAEGAPMPLGSYWQCTNTQITTPGRVAAGVTEKAFNVQMDSVINIDTFEEYAGAILTAGLNRLIRVGAKGIFGIETSAPSRGYASEEELPSAVRSAGGNYETATIDQRTGSSRADLISQINNLRTNVSQIRQSLIGSISLNNEIKNLLTSFNGWCTFEGRYTLHPSHCGVLTDQIDVSDDRNASLDQKLEEANQLFTKVNDLLARASIATESQLNSLINEISALAADINAFNDYIDELNGLQAEKDDVQTRYLGCQGSPGNGYVCD